MHYTDNSKQSESTGSGCFAKAITSARRVLIFSSVLFPLMFSAHAVQAQKGKGGGGGGTVPVKYQVSWIDAGSGLHTWARDINDRAEAVGVAYTDGATQVFAFIHSANITTDLNGLEPPPVWTDLDATSTTEAGWSMYTADGINYSGQIVGVARNQITSQKRPYVFDMDTRAAFLLPKVVGELGVGEIFQLEIEWDINAHGAVAGSIATANGNVLVVYEPFAIEPIEPQVIASVPGDSNTLFELHFNDAGIVAHGGRLYVPGNLGTFDYSNATTIVDNIQINDLNNFNWLCGNRYGGNSAGAIRRNVITNVENKLRGRGNTATVISDMNHSIVKEASSGSSFLHTDVHGLLPLQDLATSTLGDIQCTAISNPTPFTDLQTTGFGQISGFRFDNSLRRSFVLIPISTSPE